MTAFSEEIEAEFNEMAFVLEYAERGCWILAVYNQADAREQIINRLKSELKLPVFTWHYNEDKPYPIDYLQDLTEQQKQQRAVVSFINTTDGGEKTIKSLDFNREKFAHYPHSLIFWVIENERGEIARKAGHFWAQRRGTFDFSKLALTQSQQNNSHGIGSWLNNLLNIDNYSEALRQLDFYQKLLIEYSPVAQANLDNGLISVAETTDKISYLLYYLGRYSEAIDFCQKALNLYQTLLGENAYPTLAASNNLAFLYLRSGHLTKAKLLLQKTLSILEQGTDYMPAMATVLNNLAMLYGDQGKYTEAESLYQRSLVIREATLSEDHPDVAASLNNLAGLCYKQSKYVEAEFLYQKSLIILERALDKNHPEIATSLNNLAILYGKQGKYAEAEALYRRSLAISEQALGKNHPDVTSSLVNLGLFYIKQSKYAELAYICEQLMSQAIYRAMTTLKLFKKIINKYWLTEKHTRN